MEHRYCTHCSAIHTSMPLYAPSISQPVSSSRDGHTYLRTVVSRSGTLVGLLLYPAAPSPNARCRVLPDALEKVIPPRNLIWLRGQFRPCRARSRAGESVLPRSPPDPHMLKPSYPQRSITSCQICQCSLSRALRVSKSIQGE